MLGDQFYFRARHGTLNFGTENSLVFERSIDPQGMDWDLVFIYEPDAA